MSGRYTPPKRHGRGALIPAPLGANQPLPVKSPPAALMMRMGMAVTAVIEAWAKCHAELRGADYPTGTEPVIYCGDSGLVAALDALADVDRQAREAYGPPPGAVVEAEGNP